ncbi:MAG: YlxR family protein [Lachnospiraceae bacterium]|nr:YlxR family protein [Lachnospiraceae bacterium]
MVAKQVPVRQCIGCREMKPKNELVRIIRTPENEICLDKTGKKNGRGAYLCGNKACYNKAVKSRGIERSLKVEIPKEIYDAIGEELG